MKETIAFAIFWIVVSAFAYGVWLLAARALHAVSSWLD